MKCILSLLALVLLTATVLDAHAATLIIENNTNLHLEVEGRRPYDVDAPNSLKSIQGFVLPVTEKSFTVSSGYWDITIKPIVPVGTRDSYQNVEKSVVINSDSEVKSIVLYDRDFGRSNIVAPENVCEISMFGKYKMLKRKIEVKKDSIKYGSCYDLGYSDRSTYEGSYKLPKGYWVYKYPYWYIWDQEAEPGSSSDRAAAKKEGCKDPTFGGKYSKELRRISVPEDKGQYGTCNDYGWWSGTVYKNYSGLPQGYWVYDYPVWIIYGNEK